MPYVARSALCVALLLAGCECEAEPVPLDSGPIDAGGGMDAGGPDAGTDAGGPQDAGPRDAGPDACFLGACGERDECFDGIDNDCDDAIDEGCGCVPGSTTRCLPPGTSADSICAYGEMVCEGSGEFGTWGACDGADVGPSGTPYGCRRIGIIGAPGANSSSNFQTWLGTQGAIATRVHDSAAAASGALAREELETFDLVVVDWLVRTYTSEESQVLADWVSDGGGLMVMTGHDSGATADRHLSLLLELGPTYDLAAGPINGPATLVDHPTTRTEDGSATLPPITFLGGLRTVVPTEYQATITPMAQIGDAIVGVAGPYGDGSVLLFGDEWIEFDSEWSTMPPIVQFWLNTVTWLAPTGGVCN